MSNKGRPYDLEVKFTTAKGNPRWVRTMASPIIESGRVVMDVERMLWDIVQTVYNIFDGDRVWLLHPCDPDAPSFRVPIEINFSPPKGLAGAPVWGWLLSTALSNTFYVVL